MQYFFLFQTNARIAMAPKANLGLVLTNILLAGLFIGVMFLVRKRSFRLFCICAAEICLFFACKLFFGDDSIITFIMCWVTTAVACIATVAIVNRIDWSNLRGKKRSE